MAQTRRVFVGNLPHEISRDEIISKFKKYGNVESVEIRTKQDPVSGEALATFSFVNLTTDEDNLKKCVFLLNGIKLGERNIKVEAAKESFLQRLQRERAAALKTALPTSSAASVLTKSSENVPEVSTKEKKVIKKVPAPRKDSSSSESSDSEDDNEEFHPSSKLPMFKGITSAVSKGTIPVARPEVKTSDSYMLNVLKVSKVTAEKEVKINRRNQLKSQLKSKNSDVLKKFESFSDVWKDDEPSYETESFGSKQKSNLGKKQTFDTYNRNSFGSGRSDAEQQRQPLQAENKRNTLQEASKSTVINAAEEKRLKSLDAKREAFERQKKVVKLALSDQSAPRINKKIVFGEDDDDDDDDDVFNNKQPKSLHGQNFKQRVVTNEEKKQKALSLFDESDDDSAADWRNEFQVKKQFEGSKGKKLLELQSNYNNDNRFKLDERFYDNDEEAKTSKKSELKSHQLEDGVEGVETVEGVEGLAEEREQQLQILSSILGQPVSAAAPPGPNESKTKGMLRFDPSKPNHLKYELSKEPKEKKRKKKPVPADLKEKEENDDEEEDNEEENVSHKVRREEKDPEPVSQNKFYTVSDSLADSLRHSKEGQASGFSLLQMFGSPNVPSDSKKKEFELPRKELSKKEGLKKRPILDDSSSEDEEKGPTAVVEPVAAEIASNTSGHGIVSSHGVWQESFFLQPDDNRLKEAAAFFSPCGNTYDDNFAKRREELKKFISRKWHDDWNREPTHKKVGSFQKRSSSHKKSLGYRPRKKQRR